MTATPTFDSYDGTIAEALLRSNDGLSGLQAVLGMKLDRFSPGKLWAHLDIAPELITPMGSLHGGVVAAFIDHVLGCVAYPLMKRGQWAATTEFKLNYLAPVKGGRLEAESTVVSMTRRTAVVRVDVVNDDRLVATAQGTLTIVDPKPKA